MLMVVSFLLGILFSKTFLLTISILTYLARMPLMEKLAVGDENN
jgi:hypothetical protein